MLSVMLRRSSRVCASLLEEVEGVCLVFNCRRCHRQYQEGAAGGGASIIGVGFMSLFGFTSQEVAVVARWKEIAD